jgi:hypothetical protein
MKIIENLGLIKTMGKKAILFLFKILFLRLRYPKMFIRWKKAPEGWNPKPNYEIPKYEEWMKIPNFDKKREYLRPTQGCECNAPELVALAYKLGIDRLSDWDYAESVLKWVKNNIRFNFGGGTAVETLKEGMGVCIQSTTLFITLCRVKGLKARYKVMVSPELDPRLQEIGIGMAKQPGVDKIFGNLVPNFLNEFPLHILAEVQIDGKWVNADSTFSHDLEAGLGYEISKLGYEPKWASETGKIYYLEDSPRMGRPLLKWCKSLHGLQYMIDKGLENYIKKGKEILKFGKERYEEKIKKSYEGLGKDVSGIVKRVM